MVPWSWWPCVYSGSCWASCGHPLFPILPWAAAGLQRKSGSPPADRHRHERKKLDDAERGDGMRWDRVGWDGAMSFVRKVHSDLFDHQIINPFKYSLIHPSIRSWWLLITAAVPRPFYCFIGYLVPRWPSIIHSLNHSFIQSSTPQWAVRVFHCHHWV